MCTLLKTFSFIYFHHLSCNNTDVFLIYLLKIEEKIKKKKSSKSHLSFLDTDHVSVCMTAQSDMISIVSAKII